MRRAANDNPVVQMALIGVLVIALGFLFVTRIMGGGEEVQPEPTATGEATTPSATGTAEAAPTAPAEGAPAVPGEEVIPPTGQVPDKLVAGKGVPQSVAAAYGDGKAIVLLIVKRRGIDDKAVRSSVEALRGRGDLAVFVSGANDVARYSRITQGVGVSRTPALVVIRPRGLDEGPPTASVSYGFRGPESVTQAVEDALYKGPDVPYYPE